MNSIIEEGEPVYIRVYHLTKANCFLKIFGLGMFHSAIEVYNREYWFGANSTGKTGVCETKVDFHKLKLH